MNVSLTESSTILNQNDRPSPTPVAAKTIALPSKRSPVTPIADRTPENPIASAIIPNPFVAKGDRITERTISKGGFANGFAAFVGRFGVKTIDL
jgi:hypothetical protein